MKIDALPVGAIGANCYIVYTAQKQAVLIDCGGEADRILARVAELSLQVTHILITHAHYDHIGAVDAIKAATGAVVVVSEKDAPAMGNPELNLSSYHRPVTAEYDQTVREGDTISCGEMTFRVIETPGHTVGGVCYYTVGADGGALFSGDTLFHLSVGRCDFPGGNFDDIIDSVVNKLMTLPPDTTVYPGHEMTSTIAYERQYNPYVLNSH